MVAWGTVLPIILLAALVAVEDLISASSYEISGHASGDSSHPDDLKVMMVADLLFLGSDAWFVDLYFRDVFSDIGMWPYELKHTLPANATVYNFQALKPSVHTHSFCDYAHADGTPEVTVPAMTWAAGGSLGLFFVTFGL